MPLPMSMLTQRRSLRPSSSAPPQHRVNNRRATTTRTRVEHPSHHNRATRCTRGPRVQPGSVTDPPTFNNMMPGPNLDSSLVDIVLF
jgi:hypothetical protein